MSFQFPSGLILYLAAGLVVAVHGDDFVQVPSGRGNTLSFDPFLIHQKCLPLTNCQGSIRYQQVYDASAFYAVKPSNTYVTRLFFVWDAAGNYGFYGLVLSPESHIRLSTTSRARDQLSTNFAQNVGADEVTVFDPSMATTEFVPTIGSNLVYSLTKPFVYNPAKGNLLMDVRVQNISPTIPGSFYLDANDDRADGVSRVYANSVDAAVATTVDTVGLVTGFQFSAIPSLKIYTSTFNTPTNYLAIEWPSDPSVFVLQQSARLGSDAAWQPVTGASAPRYFFPVESAGPAAFYRLFWASGQPVGPAMRPVVPTKSPETVPAK